MAVCSNCKKLLPKREFLCCAKCNLMYDLDCANVSIQRFNNTMSSERKKTWICRHCIRKTNTPSTKTPTATSTSTPIPSSINKDEVPIDTEECSSENNKVTHRKPRNLTPISRSYEDSFVQTEVLDDVPNINKSVYKSVENLQESKLVKDMKTELEKVKIELNSVQNELEDMILENNKLNRTINDLNRQISFLKDICKQSNPINQNNNDSSMPPQEQIRSDNHNLPKNTADLSDIDDIINSSNGNNTFMENKIQIEEIERQMTKLKNSLKEAQDEIARSNVAIDKFRNELLKTRVDDQLSKYSRRSKLCIISSSGSNQITQLIANQDFGRRYEYCHYIKTGAGALQLLEGIDKKLTDFSFGDYCLIVLGEQDFNQQKDNMKLIREIRNILQKILHTNVIVLPPTYICGAPIFNYKVEMFNKLLYKDVNEHQYAYMLDSNRDLIYSMFSPRTGKLNKAGMRALLFSVRNLIYEIEYERNLFRE